MNLEEKITKSIIVSMKSKDAVRLESLRSIKSSLLLLKTKNRNTSISETEEVQLLQKLVKQRKESAIIYKDQNRSDLADQEEAQAKIISEFLPKPISEEELEKIIDSLIDEIGATDMKDMGVIMSKASIKLAWKTIVGDS